MASGVDTHTHTPTHTHTNTHIYFGGTKVISRNQAHAGLQLAYAWFNKGDLCKRIGAQVYLHDCYAEAIFVASCYPMARRMEQMTNKVRIVVIEHKTVGQGYLGIY